jgi:hypothetical protein
VFSESNTSGKDTTTTQIKAQQDAMPIAKSLRKYSSLSGVSNIKTTGNVKLPPSESSFQKKNKTTEQSCTHSIGPSKIAKMCDHDTERKPGTHP